MHQQDNPAPLHGQQPYTQGMALYRQGQFAAAVGELSHLRDRHDVMGRVGSFYEGMALRAMGIEALKAGDYLAAEKHLQAAAAIMGNRADLAEHLACLYARTGRYDQCAAAAERQQTARHDEPAQHRRLALAQWHSGRRCDAYLTMHRALRLFGDDGPMLVQLGLFHAAEGDYAQARQAVARAAEIDCSNAQAHYRLGMIEAATGQVRAALRCFQRAYELDPADLTLAFQLPLAARAAMQDGYQVFLRLPEPSIPVSPTAAGQLAAYLVAEPDYLVALLSLPPSDIDEDLFGMLAEMMDIALARHEGYADLHYYQARIKERIHRTAEAADHARRCVEINPRYVQAWLLLAGLRESVGDAAAAADDLQHAIDAGGNWPDLHFRLAGLLKTAGLPQQADEHVKTALTLNPRYAPAATRRAA
ncbi:MAG: tetratricopeptide repeat protein [Planctomycetaceae bacterium]|nr:tetratricopeptide repeat protein [Planctomycetaceae bacterium]